MRPISKLITWVKSPWGLGSSGLIVASLFVFLVLPQSPYPCVQKMLCLMPQGISWNAFLENQSNLIPLSTFSKTDCLPSSLQPWPLFLEPTTRVALSGGAQEAIESRESWVLTKLAPIACRYQWEGYAVAADGDIISMIVDTQNQRSLRARCGKHLEGTSVLVERIELQPEAIVYLTDLQHERTLALPLRQTAYTGEWEAIIASSEDKSCVIMLDSRLGVDARGATWKIIEVNPEADGLLIEKLSADGAITHYQFCLENAPT